MFSNSLPRNGAALKVRGLVYLTDQAPGIKRIVSNRGFVFVSSNGRTLTSARALTRIRTLVIPPAWREVWISPNPRSHIQVTGRDARGRKQYIYHPRWREFRDRVKYDHLVEFAERLGTLRDRIDRDLRRPGLSKERVLATVVKLLQTTSIRIGNEEYAKSNRSFGLTTLRNQHVSVRGSHVRFQFRGKSGIRHTIDLNDRRLAPIIKQCQDLPGQELFEYESDEGFRPITSTDVNAYLREAMGDEFTAKDFRTWAGTVLTAMTLRNAELYQNEAQAKRQINFAIEQTARRLGNTKTVCRKCYVHPTIIDAYRSGELHSEAILPSRGRTPRRLSQDEAAAYWILRCPRPHRSPASRVASAAG